MRLALYSNGLFRNLSVYMVFLCHDIQLIYLLYKQERYL